MLKRIHPGLLAGFTRVEAAVGAMSRLLSPPSPRRPNTRSGAVRKAKGSAKKAAEKSGDSAAQPIENPYGVEDSVDDGQERIEATSTA